MSCLGHASKTGISKKTFRGKMMLWLKDKRVCITANGKTVDAEIKGIVTNVDAIGFCIQRDKGSPVTLTWRYLDSHQIVHLDEEDTREKK